MSNRIKEIQKALKGQGFDPGPVDGIWGRKTIVALRDFQSKKGLEVDGVVGPKTLAALFPVAGGPVAPASDDDSPLVWYEEAKRWMGTREVPGLKNNPDIIDWAKDLDIKFPGDDIPWCGLFVAHCIASTLTEEPLPKIPLLARAWLKCGKKCEPGLGAILVFWRGDPKGPSGHVGFYRGEDNDAFHVLGGNQADSVSITRIAKGRLLEARWPATAGSLKPRKVERKPDSRFSTNEQ